MKYVNEFRNANLVKKLVRKLHEVNQGGEINIMEVCGTHTQAYARFALAALLPSNLKLISGPGCPVCVSTQGYIDASIALARLPGVEILTFGDMLRVPGTRSSLEKEKAGPARVKVVYSALDSVRLAKLNPGKRFVFLAVGFETTAPTIALSVLLARKEKLKNLFFLTSLKLIPPVMQALLKDKRLNLQGFLCPGHVSCIIGTRPYAFIPKNYGIGCCVAGFQPLDILGGLYFLMLQINAKSPRVDNQYARLVDRDGNPRAKRLMLKVFKAYDASWMGLGNIALSGLRLKEEYAAFDAQHEFKIKEKKSPVKEKNGCGCALVLRGLLSPPKCALFAKGCTPLKPLGPCMVTSEGSCNAYYKYH